MAGTSTIIVAREDLSPIEEARGYAVLMDEFSFALGDVSERVGRSKPAISNKLRLLELPDDVLAMVERGELTEGHARAVVALFLLAAAGAGFYTAEHFKMDTDSEKLISSKLDWRQRDQRFDRLFPQRTNVEFCEVKAPDRLRVRVWERGVGVTKACGTGACAALVAANRRRLCERKATVEMDGGDLVIEWRREDDHVMMTGPIEVEFTGKLP